MQGFKRLLPILGFVLAIFTIPAVASAETLYPIAGERIAVEVPKDGLDCDITVSNGAIDIYIKEADWQSTVLDDTTGLLSLRVTVRADDALMDPHYKSLLGYFEDGEIAALSSPHGLIPGDQVVAVASFATLKHTLSGTLVVPKDITGLRLAVCWYEGLAEEPSITRICTINVRHANRNACYVSLPVPEESRVRMNVGELPGLDCEYEPDGGIHYLAKNLAALKERIGNPGSLYVFSAVEAPENAAKYKLLYDTEFSEVEGGYCEIKTCIASGDEVYGGYILGGGPISWYDEHENLILKETMKINYYNASEGVWPGAAWSPVPANRIVVNQTLADAGIRTDVSAGNVTLNFGDMPRFDRFDGLPQIRIIPPVGAVAYRCNLSSGPIYDTDSAAWQEAYLKSELAEWVALGESGCFDHWISMADTARLENDGEVYYSAEDPYLFAHTLVIDWYADGTAEEPIKREYLMSVVGRFGYVAERPAVGGLRELNGSVAAPSIVGEEGWMLRTEYVPLRGENFTYYELSLWDEAAGRFLQTLENEAPVVFPFPNGMCYEDAQNYEFVIRHYSYDLETIAEVKAEVTPYGLIFSASGFSPYAVFWTASQEPPLAGSFSGVSAPVILEQPASVTAAPGARAVFSVRVLGEGVGCQWQVDRGDAKGWVNIGTDGPAYETSAVSVKNDGYRYRCVASNAYGTAISETAVLHIERVRVPSTGGRAGFGGHLLPALAIALIALIARFKRGKA